MQRHLLLVPKRQSKSGTYTYETTFDLTGYNPATASITGQYSTDNWLSENVLNGQVVDSFPNNGISEYGGWQMLPTIGSGFVSGVNTLDFVVVNDTQSNNNPTGLRVEMNGTADKEPTVQFAMPTYGVGEKGGSATIDVTLSQSYTRPVSVAYATANGSAVAGTDYTATSGTLTFAPGQTSQSFSVPINWGDGSPLDTGAYIESMGNGMYEIVAPHSYSLTSNQVGPLTYTVDVTLTAVDGTSASTTSTIVVGQLAAGVPAVMDNWGFADQNANATPSDFVANGQSGVALINWGDGTTSLGTITGGGSGGGTSAVFDIAGTHTYTQDGYDQPNGQYQITVTVTDVDGSTLTGTQYVSVVRPQESLNVANVDIASSLTVSNEQVAVFTVPNATDAASEFTAQINWGDGNTSSGTIQEVAPGLFQVLGSHTYATYNWYTMTVTISQGWEQYVSNAEGTGKTGGKIEIKFYQKIAGAPGTGTIYRSTHKLAVAKWQYAFDPKKNYELIQNPNGYKDGMLFINRDPDHFQVRVQDPMNKGAATVDVNVQTSSDTGHDITLTETGKNTGVYISQWLLLTTFSVDKAAGQSETLNVKLGDEVRAIYSVNGEAKADTTATVPILKQVKLFINVLRDRQGGTPVATKTDVKFDVSMANGIYAAAGIHFIIDRLQFVNPPAKLGNLSNGVETHFKNGTDTDSNGKIGLTKQEEAIFAAQNLLPPREEDGITKKDIAIYYINYFVDGNGAKIRTGYGEALPARYTPVLHPGYADSIIVSADYEQYQTLAHEIGHILENSGDHTNSKVNLMYGGVPPSIEHTPTDSRRITATQANRMRDNRPNLSVTPSS